MTETTGLRIADRKHIGLAEMLKGGVIMDVTNAEQAKIAEDAGAASVMALERVPSDIRKDGGVARMSPVKKIQEIQKAVTIPVMAKARIGHFVEAQILEALGIDFIDEGTSGGIWGLQNGYCLMIGGPKPAYERLEPAFKSLAPPTGYMHCGTVGSGHFVKMIHNGIEYGMMQAIAEGLDILKHANSPRLPEEARLAIDVADTAEVWRRGSVITSWLLDLTAAALAEDAELTAYSGHVEDSGEGRWTVQAAIDEAVPAEVLTSALYARFRSRQGRTFAEKVLSAMRKGFGGHVEPKTGG